VIGQRIPSPRARDMQSQIPQTGAHAGIPPSYHLAAIVDDRNAIEYPERLKTDIADEALSRRWAIRFHAHHAPATRCSRRNSLTPNAGSSNGYGQKNCAGLFNRRTE
jgi:hypothetical protein